MIVQGDVMEFDGTFKQQGRDKRWEAGGHFNTSCGFMMICVVAQIYTCTDITSRPISCVNLSAAYISTHQSEW